MKNKEGKFISFLMASAGILVIGVLVLEMVLVNLWKEIYYDKERKVNWCPSMGNSIYDVIGN